MPNKLEDVDLSRDSFHVCNFSDLAFFENFYGDVLIGWLMQCGFDLAEGALADSLAWNEAKCTDKIVSELLQSFASSLFSHEF